MVEDRIKQVHVRLGDTLFTKLNKLAERDETTPGPWLKDKLITYKNKNIPIGDPPEKDGVSNNRVSMRMEPSDHLRIKSWVKRGNKPIAQVVRYIIEREPL